MKSDPEPPADLDPVIRAYWDGVDVTLLRKNLRLTVEQRLEQLMEWQRSVEALQQLGKTMRPVGASA